MKRVGTYNGVPLYESPFVEPGQVFFIPHNGLISDLFDVPNHDYYVRFGHRPDRWQKVRAWIRKHL